MRKLLPLAALALAAVTAFAADTPPTTASLGKKAPDFTLTDAAGKSISLHDYAGKIVVLEWINKDCPIDSRVLGSKLSTSVEQKYHSKNVVFLAIDSSHTHVPADLTTTAQKFGISYPILNDFNGKVGHEYDAKTTPHMFIINTDGTLVYQGGIDNDPNGDAPSTRVNYVDQALGELLANKPVSVPESKPYGCSVKYAD